MVTGLGCTWTATHDPLRERVAEMTLVGRIFWQEIRRNGRLTMAGWTNSERPDLSMPVAEC
jgi:hypothetical protein